MGMYHWTLFVKLTQQYYKILLNWMRAQYRIIGEEMRTRQDIQVVCNEIVPNYVKIKLASKKYKKVGKETREKLINCIQKGWSIINIAKKFNINYSTAKSIAQHHRKRELTLPSPQEIKIECIASSTDSSYDAEIQKDYH